ncbi:hypothetical protein CI266_004930 [Salmonella enterica subsp. enterica serovar Kotte]|nr:hypothetical protein [Salmonella enterica subsp. enterica serovar Kotte]
MKLSDVATIKTNFPEADFWIVRRGSLKTVGKPEKVFNSEYIGIQITRRDILLPDYLYYCLIHLHQQNIWKGIATGSLALVNIRVSDVKEITLKPR